jgi:hypothetical protein
MKKIVLMIFCLNILNGISQDKYLTFKSGFTTGITGLGNWKEYASIYNDDNRDFLKTKLGRMNFTNGYELGLGYNIVSADNIAITIEIINERKMATTSAEFKDPALGKRVFDARYTTNTFVFSFGGKGDNMALTAGVYLGFSQTNLSAYKKYSDGTISYGNENGSNGTYRAAGFCTGFKIGADLFLTENIHLYTNILGGATIDLSSDTPLPTAGLAFPLIYVNKHLTLQIGTRIGINW